MQNISFPRLQISFFLYFSAHYYVLRIFFSFSEFSMGGIRIWMLFHLCNFLVMHVCVCMCVQLHCFGILFCTAFDCANWKLLHGHCAMQCYGMWCEAVLLLNSECSRLLPLLLLLLAVAVSVCTHIQHVLATEAFFLCFRYVQSSQKFLLKSEECGSTKKYTHIQRTATVS